MPLPPGERPTTMSSYQKLKQRIKARQLICLRQRRSRLRERGVRRGEILKLLAVLPVRNSRTVRAALKRKYPNWEVMGVWRETDREIKAIITLAQLRDGETVYFEYIIDEHL